MHSRELHIELPEYCFELRSSFLLGQNSILNFPDHVLNFEVHGLILADLSHDPGDLKLRSGRSQA